MITKLINELERFTDVEFIIKNRKNPACRAYYVDNKIYLYWHLNSYIATIFHEIAHWLIEDHELFQFIPIEKETRFEEALSESISGIICGLSILEAMDQAKNYLDNNRKYYKHACPNQRVKWKTVEKYLTIFQTTKEYKKFRSIYKKYEKLL